MKRYVKLLSAVMALLVIMAFTPLGTVAESDPTVYEYVEGWGTWYYIVEDGGATLTSYGGDGESFYLPDTLGGYPLKVIGESACAYKDWLTEVDIPDSVVEIGYYAFGVCTFLETVNMGDNVEIIDDYAFIACESLKEVNFGTGVKEIGAHAFDSCYSLEEIAIPDGVEVLQDRTFDRCSALQNVYLPDSLYFIGNNAFSLCESLREITIPEGVTYIGEYAFNGCSALEQIALPATVGYIQEAAFRFCDSLTDVYYSGTPEARDLTNIDIENDPLYDATWHYGWIGPMPPLTEKPSGSETNPDYFYRTYVDGGVVITGYWGSDTDIVIPAEIYGDPVVGIGDGAFSYSELTSVVIPEGVTYIEEYAFSGCESLAWVSLPSTLESIGESAFKGCTSLELVKYNGTETKAAEIAIGERNDYLLNATWQYADGEEEPEEPEGPLMTEDGFYYEVGDDGNVTITRYAGEGGDVVIPDEIDGYPVIAVGDRAFINNPDVTSVTIPDSVTRIGNSAFAKCKELTSVVIGDGVTTIGYRAFAETDNLTDVVVGDGVKRIEARAFYASGITSMVLPDTVVSIGESAFAECKALASINIPASLETINDETFYKCESLQSIVFPESLYEIRGMAFSQSGLTSIHIPATLEYFDYNALPTTLRSITVAEDHPYYMDIDGVMFNKEGTTLVRYPAGRVGVYTVPEGVTTIGTRAFYDATGLSMVTLSDSVETLENSAFLFCSALTWVDLNNVVSVGLSAFTNCENLASVAMGTCTKYFDGAAFANTKLSSVWYRGTVADRENISYLMYDCPKLDAAKWYYESAALEVQYADEVEHSAMDTESGTGLAFKFDLSVSVGVKNGNEVDYTDATIEYMGYTCKLVGMGSVVTNRADVDPVLENVNGTTVIDVPVVYLTEWNEDSCSFAIRIINIPESALDRIIYARPYYVIEVNGEQIVIYGEMNSATAAEYMA